MALKTNVYIDAFNLYYGFLRKTPYRWLDLGANRVAEPTNHVLRFL